MKGLKRINARGTSDSPTPREWRCVERNILEDGTFSRTTARNKALACIRAIARYDSLSAKVLRDNLAEADRSELDHCVERLGFEFDFPELKPEPESRSKPRRARKPRLKIVR